YKSLWMVTFLQRTFTSLVHAHAGRTQVNQSSPAAGRANARPLLMRYTLIILRLIKYRGWIK
ncbi:hypothetical protein, partial [Neptuniibacter pectenicola]|uniref:hypothetical protein n=1 Tax=Neptuniibacter pectenicola TaxID=1806669 RepID=UPI001E32A894